MLTTLLLVLLIGDSIILVAAILLQSGKGTGIAANFGGVSSSSDSLIGTRQAGNLLTTITWWSGGLFLGIAFILQIASTRSHTPHSVLDQPFSRQPAPVETAPALPLQPAGSPQQGTAPTATQSPTPAPPPAAPTH